MSNNYIFNPVTLNELSCSLYIIANSLMTFNLTCGIVTMPLYLFAFNLNIAKLLHVACLLFKIRDIQDKALLI